MSKHQRSKQKKSVEQAKGAPKKSGFNWFPGHMMKALRKMKQHIGSVDIIIEIRDARSPFVTSNVAFNEQVGNKCRLIVINKTNLADPKVVELWKPWFEKQGEPFIFINALDKNSLIQIVDLASSVFKDNILQSNPDYVLSEKLKMMVIGLPNTGKSTVINKLSNRNASKVADKPGQTQQQLWVNVNKNLMILDTPGVMPPTVETDEQVLWLSALHAIPERVLEIENTVCYVIEHILKTNPTAFSNQYKFEQTEAQYNLLDTLNLIAKARGYIRQGAEYDYDRVYKTVLHDFRAGLLGPISFGSPPISI